MENKLNIDKMSKLNFLLCILFIIMTHLDSKLSAILFLVLVINTFIYKKVSLYEIKDFLFRNKLYVLSIFTFMLLPFIALIFHGSPISEFNIWLGQIRNEIIGIIFPLILLRSKIKVIYLFWVSAVMVNISAFWGYYKYYVLNTIRLSSFITDNPNVYSTYLLILFCVIIYSMHYINKYEHQHKYKYICTFTLINIFTSLIIANSRGCILLFFIEIIAFLLIKFKNNKIYLLLSVFVSLTFLSGLFVFNQSFQNRINNTIASSKIDNERFIIYSTAINIIKEHPLIGIGKGNFQKQYEKHNEYKNINNKIFYHVHQIVLEMMVESGILGLIAFFIFIFGQIKVYIKGYLNNNLNMIKKYAALMCLFITCLVFAYMQVENTYFALRKIYWIYISIGYYLLIRPEPSNNK